MKVLIIDDEELIRNVIKEYLIHDNIEVVEASDGLEALDILKNENINAIVLDIMMPKMDGYTFFKEMKKNYEIPTIIVSARSDEFDKLQGFDLGVDDYLTKPFSPRELVARIKAITKRYLNDEKDVYVYQTLKINFKAHVLTIDDQEIKITLKEYELLKYFINNPNIAIPRDELLNKIWGYDFYGDDRTIDTHIKMLRANLGRYREMIQTIRGVGYKFVQL